MRTQAQTQSQWQTRNRARVSKLDVRGIVKLAWHHFSRPTRATFIDLGAGNDAANRIKHNAIAAVAWQFIATLPRTSNEQCKLSATADDLFFGN
jgi:hypothetical protein